MSYQALYRKWRPLVFSDVVGQDHITQTLKIEVANGKVAHAYLFCGSRGTGKTTCAKIMAKAVNCENPNDGDPCCKCKSCVDIQSGRSLDILELDAASNSGVDNIRDIRDEMVYTPANAKKRIYILDEAHMLSTGAFNALLKSLEEPPEHVIFILATTESHKVPATILSRCQRFDFRRIPAHTIAERLKKVCQGEGIEATLEALGLLARLADGSLRDGLSLLDQCASAGKKLTAEYVSEVTGLVGHAYLSEFAVAIARKDIKAALMLLDDLYSKGKEVLMLCSELILFFRNLMLFKTVNDPGALLAASRADEASLKEAASGFELSDILSILKELSETLDQLYKSHQKRLELELCLIRICSPQGHLTPSSSFITKIESPAAVTAGKGFGQPCAGENSETADPGLPKPESPPTKPEAQVKGEPEAQVKGGPEAQVKGGPEAQVKGGPEPEIAKAQPFKGPEEVLSPPPEAPPPAEGAADSGVLSRLWNGITKYISENDSSLFPCLSSASPALSGEQLFIMTDDSFAKNILGRPENLSTLEKAACSAAGRPIAIRVIDPKNCPKNAVKLHEAKKNIETLKNKQAQFPGIVTIKN